MLENVADEPVESFTAGIREELQNILASPGFVSSVRSSRLLEYIVETALRGDHEKLKEYVLGIEVFGRPESFDPRMDSLVRSQVTHLRKRLRAYYNSVGHMDSIRIEIPPGTYVPRFEPLTKHNSLSDSNLDATEYGAQIDHRPTIAVLPCTDLGHLPDHRMCEALTDELITVLAQTPTVRVVAGAYAAILNKRFFAPSESEAHPPITALLETTARCIENTIKVTARLFSLDTWCVTWVKRLDQDAGDRVCPEKAATAIVLALSSELSNPEADPS